LRLGVVGHDAVERDRIQDDRGVQAQQPRVVAAGVFRREDHGRDVGRGPAIVVTEVVQVENQGSTLQSRPPRQLEAGRMPAERTETGTQLVLTAVATLW
jgi:hypothetical protein